MFRRLSDPNVVIMYKFLKEAIMVPLPPSMKTDFIRACLNNILGKEFSPVSFYYEKNLSLDEERKNVRGFFKSSKLIKKSSSFPLIRHSPPLPLDFANPPRQRSA